MNQIRKLSQKLLAGIGLNFFEKLQDLVRFANINRGDINCEQSNKYDATTNESKRPLHGTVQLTELGLAKIRFPVSGAYVAASIHHAAQFRAT